MRTIAMLGMPWVSHNYATRSLKMPCSLRVEFAVFLCEIAFICLSQSYRLFHRRSCVELHVYEQHGIPRVPCHGHDVPIHVRFDDGTSIAPGSLISCNMMSGFCKQAGLLQLRLFTFSGVVSEVVPHRLRM